MASFEAPSDRDPGPGWGLAVLGAWLLLVASGFWNLVALPMRDAAAAALDPVQARQVEHWARSVAPTGGRRLLVDLQACACDPGPRETLLRRLRASGVSVRALDATAPRLPQRPELVLLDADGNLRYAGPAAPTLFCSGGRHVVETAIDVAARAPALVLPAECRCVAG